MVNFSLFITYYLSTIIHIGQYKNNLKKLRFERGLLTKNVAVLLGLHCQDRLSHWETGRSMPSIPNLFKLREIYGVELYKLYELIQAGSIAVTE